MRNRLLNRAGPIYLAQISPRESGAVGSPIWIRKAAPVFEALIQVATAMAQGQGVTVMPQNALLTTQEAAELLGISRPTLVRLLADGDIPYDG
jgi:Helix-turn-helix domain